MDEKNLPRYCVLAYRRQAEVSSSISDSDIVIIAVLQTYAALRIYKHPNLDEVVQPSDIEYLKDLLQDMAGRMKVNADGLFAQLCRLNVGPLTTHRIGLDLASDEALDRLIKNFIEI